MRYRLIALIQIVFFAAWGIHALSAYSEATEIYLQTMPVDPRDYLKGHYVRLRYAMQADIIKLCAPKIHELRGSATYSSRKPLYIALKEGNEQATLKTGENVPYWKPVRCELRKPSWQQNSPTKWLKGYAHIKVAGSPGRRPPRNTPKFDFGIYRYYVPENSPLRQARSGQVIAKVAINREGVARIIDLTYLKTK